MMINCEYCGKPVRHYLHKNQKHYFCSRECYGKFYKGKPHWWISSPTGKKRNKWITVKCEFCGKPFEKLITEERRFCSRGCALESRRKRPIIKIKCEWCHKEFETPGANRKFCSRECALNFRINHPTTAKYPIKYPHDWSKIVEVIRAESGDMCPLCGYKNIENKPFPVHHKIPPRYFIVNPEKAHDRNNLIAICVSCHLRVDRRGRPNTDRSFLY